MSIHHSKKVYKFETKKASNDTNFMKIITLKLEISPNRKKCFDLITNLMPSLIPAQPSA